MSTQDEPANTLMDKLKESTRKMHDSAEGSRFQGLLGNGVLPKQVYADYLEQLYLVHSSLESGIRTCPQYARIVSDAQLQEPFLKKDLECLGRDAKKINALPATQRLLEKIREQTKSSPYALLGMHYVLLGSKHGGKFIAKICQEKYQFSDGLGVCYFDPYGPNFMPIWKSFREEMNQHQFEPEEIERICAAAATMFRAVTEIGDELMPLVKA